MTEQNVSAPVAEPSTAELMRQISEDTRRLVRDEIALAQVEVKTKARRTGIGLGRSAGQASWSTTASRR